LEPGRSYYVVRGGKTIAAWTCGARDVCEAGFRVLAAHTDSPTLRLKPASAKSADNLSLLSIEVYGSALLHTWLDRDSRLAGAAYLREGEGGAIRTQVISLDPLVVRASSLAIHLGDRSNPGVVLDPNKDLDLFLACGAKADAVRVEALVAQACGVGAEAVAGYDLRLADAQPAAFIGVGGEFLSAPRLDNLFSCYSALEALLSASQAGLDQTTLAAFFDAEEIGSQTQSGARSDFLVSVLKRIGACDRVRTPQSFARTAARSYMISADMAHARHPAFPDRSDAGHAPLLNAGIAVKYSARANYADSGALAAWFETACTRAGTPMQRFMYKAGCGGGSSVGPMVASLTGIQAIDVGAPMLAMHSAREICGARDVEASIQALTLFLTEEIILRA
jgi:aspartyl aminopeptidase